MKVLQPKNGLENHYKWILWKLASLVRRFPSQLKSFWKPENVEQQLCFRYDKEILAANRSASEVNHRARPYAHRSDGACISDIYSYENENVLELTDGWYKIPVTLDSPLEVNLSQKKIYIGQKLYICNAELREKVPAVDALDCPGSLNSVFIITVQK
ncbi:hypothetical protein BC829DRAFT_106932 [Chytridium lagenaria]|nr:hypothetical protein BC829DRAFT_106932 [Chytridium lagenaria]